jgi:hypothetical protein
MRRRPTLARLVHRRREHAGQDGYVLMFVLGIIALTSVVVVALLGLALTSARVARDEAELARETRAADGALEAATSRVAVTGGDPCGSWEPPNDTSTVPFAGAGGSTMPVQVTCSVSGTPTSPDGDLPGPDVDVVGTTPYAGAIAAPSVPGVSGATVVSTGDQPLMFNSDVAVTAGAAPENTGTGPAVEVSGQYSQGSVVGGGGCGVLGTAGPHQIVDHSGAPTCGTATSIATVAPSSIAGLPINDQASVANCPGGRVDLAPGRYSRALTEGLNTLLSGTTQCTVVFLPGVHYLDVFHAGTGTDRFVLNMSNPNALVVGGVPRNATVTAADFPRACRTDDASGGVQLVLSGRSAIRHTAGHVALCPAHQGGTTIPVLTQSGYVDVQPQMVGVPSTVKFAPAAALGSDVSWASATACTWFLIAVCPTPQPSFTTTWQTSGVGPLTSAYLLVDMQQIPWTLGTPDTPASFSSISVYADLRIVKGAKTCTQSNVRPGRTISASLAYDLLGGPCASVFTDQTDLDGASVTYTFKALDTGGRGLTVKAKNVRLETNTVTVLPSRVDSASADWVNPAGVYGADEATVNPDPLSSNPPVNWDKRTGSEYQLTVSGFAPPASLPADTQLSSLQVVMRAGTDTLPNLISDPHDGAKVRLTLTSGSNTCNLLDSSAAAQSFDQSNQTLRYELNSSGNCIPSISTVGQLADATLRASFVTGCLTEGSTWPVLKPGDPSKCKSVPVPAIDVLGISFRTDLNTQKPPPSSITVATGSGTSFDAFGPVLLPASDLDINWNGDHYSRPVFGDHLQVRALGSQQGSGGQVGIVCCSIREGAAVLQASVDGTVRAQAVIQVDPDGTGTVAVPRAVRILDWKLCGRGGCPA